jgi:carboxymethylenebutenolidase
MIIQTEHVDLPTQNGLMRAEILRPVAAGKYPGLVLFSEIFQITAPIRRTAALLAGHGFVVAVPEVYHEFLPAGTVLAYDTAGAEQGNQLKTTKTLVGYDDDARAALAFLKSHSACTGRLGVMGMCLGGHLAFRAAMNPEVRAGVCFYATDIHKGGLGKGMNDDSLARLKEIKGELLMVWGKQDPHVPREGRALIYDAMTDARLNFTWHKFNGQHAFLRDEGPRYDAELALKSYGLALELFKRKLSEGDLPAAQSGAPKESKH